jgi:hypothetical protein
MKVKIKTKMNRFLQSETPDGEWLGYISVNHHRECRFAPESNSAIAFKGTKIVFPIPHQSREKKREVQ